MRGLVKTIIGVSILLLCCCLWTQVTWAHPAEKSPLLKAMEEELERSKKGLTEKGNPPPYFISFYVAETQRIWLSASYGALRQSSTDHSRMLDVEVRVGDYKLDNTHRLRGVFDIMSRIPRPVFIPLEDDMDAIKSVIWLETDKRYKEAVERLVEVQSQKTVKVKEEDESADFSLETPEKYVGSLSKLSINMDEWKNKLKEYSKLFKPYSEIHESNISFMATATNKYIVNSEGTVVQFGQPHWRISLFAGTKADDGMDLYRFESFDAHSMEGLPDENKLHDKIELVAKDLLALREAPVIEPFTGPAILSGRAASVFFHEIFGHRIEGHRQKDEEEGQTFKKMVNKEVLPEFISIFDDPTQAHVGGNDLSGYFLFDDEGVKAERVTIVDSGILKNFVMSRSPIEGFVKSNGHGRKQVGFRAVARQGNLIVEATRTVPEQKLREMLIEECKKQGKPFGLIFDDISGGFTYTGRVIPQAYAVVPIIVYRVYTDGRPDELVRGADLIGTPLVSFSKILVCGDKAEVFNGTCGAESGGVPVSGVSPSILTGEIEIQKKAKSPDRPPLLPPPKRRIP